MPGQPAPSRPPATPSRRFLAALAVLYRDLSGFRLSSRHSSSGPAPGAPAGMGCRVNARRWWRCLRRVSRCAQARNAAQTPQSPHRWRPDPAPSARHDDAAHQGRRAQGGIHAQQQRASGQVTGQRQHALKAVLGRQRRVLGAWAQGQLQTKGSVYIL